MLVLAVNAEGKGANLPDSLRQKLQALPEGQRDSFLLDEAWNYYSMYTREGYLAALECNMAAYDLAVEQGHKDAIIRAYKGMAAVHDASNNPLQAIKYYQLYYNGIRSKKDPQLNFFALYNLALSYTKMSNTKALEYIPLMEKEMYTSKDSSVIYIGYLFIAGIYSRFKDYKNLELYYEKLPDKINFEDHNYAYGRIYAEVTCRYLIEKRQPKKAIALLQQQLSITHDSIPVLLSLINFSAETGNYKLAHEYHKILDDYNVRKTNAQIQSTIDYKLLSVENELKEQANRQLKLREQTLKKNNLALYIVAQVLLIILILLAFIFTKFRKQNKRLSQQNAFISSQNEHIAVLLREIHHRVKNNLQIISSLIELELLNPGKDPLGSLLKIQAKMSSFALVHQMMYENASQDQISLQPYFDQMVGATIQILASPADQMSTNIEMGDSWLEPNRLVLLALLVNELITNTCKHVLPYRNPCRIELSCKMIDDELHISYSDSGGPPGKPAKPGGMGKRLIPRLAFQMDAKLDVREEAGSIAYTLVLSKAA
jgi:two-component sensor histidine kinase